MSKRKTKTPFRREAVMAYIRDLIVSGRYGPGDRLPSRAEVADACSAPPLTVQDAFDRLVAHGFVEVQGRRGSFVAGNLPHVERLVLAFPDHPGSSGWGEFWTRVDQVARRIAKQRGLWLDVIYDVERGLEGEERLSAEILANRVAGILFGSSPHVVKGTPTLDQPGPVRAALMGGEGRTGVIPMVLGVQSVYQRILEHLTEHAVKRPAFILPTVNFRHHGDWLMQGLAERGIAAERHLFQLAGATDCLEAAQLVRLLLALPRSGRPDALVVGDDNLLEPVLATLGELGVDPGSDLRVVVQANFPVDRDLHPDVDHIGFSIPEIVGATLDLMQDRIAGGKARPRAFLAYREDEVDEHGWPLVGD